MDTQSSFGEMTEALRPCADAKLLNAEVVAKEGLMKLFTLGFLVSPPTEK
jgi:hypothetical protein